MNETLATVWLEQSLAASATPLSIFANLAYLRDEIDHARLGWAHLASEALDADLREALASCIPRLLAANLPLWRTPDPFIRSPASPATARRPMPKSSWPSSER